MAHGKHRDPMGRRSTRPAKGRHREGVGLIPVGDRNRVPAGVEDDRGDNDPHVR